MTKKIFTSILLVAGLVLVASFGIIMGVLYQYFSDVQEKQLEEELNIAAAAVQTGEESFLEQVKLENYRITWVARDGSVLYDSKADVKNAGNHADREEIKEAFQYGKGETTRYSSTLMEKTMYYAKKLDDGTVLRISISHASVWWILIGMMQPLIIALVVALILSAILARRISKRIMEPLNHLDLEHPLDNKTYEELAPLLGRINKQHNQIADQLSLLQQKTDEFEQITQNMSEGLILLDAKGVVLSINPAAQQLYKTGSDVVGKNFLTVDRSVDMSHAIERALDEGHSEIRTGRNGREYQFDISRINSGGSVIGEVILSFDVTEQASAERNRREFTANVSHELKTPLQGIIGSAQLLENGMVKPEDVPRFVGHIGKEAQRLMTLIEDIIRLSQLDEGMEPDFEDTDLFAVAAAAVSRLKDKAGRKNINLTFAGEDVHIMGISALLDEIVYNLCDNSIKYNNPGGNVQVRVYGEGDKAVISVQDDGIGIGQEHQSRIFERFYCVDKSHSKASGGTGLGLSIVKHAVMLHKGKIDLQSEPGKGTQIKIIFPMSGFGL